MIASASTLVDRVREAIIDVADPEYPDVSIVDLGLLESIRAEGGSVVVGLIPTYSGCPALVMIAADVNAVVRAVPGVSSCRVEWLRRPVWSTSRISDLAAEKLASEYSVVLRSGDGSLRCSVCGGRDVRDQAMAGPTRCRSIAWCEKCRNPIEVMR